MEQLENKEAKLFYMLQSCQLILYMVISVKICRRNATENLTYNNINVKMEITKY